MLRTNSHVLLFTFAVYAAISSYLRYAIVSLSLLDFFLSLSLSGNLLTLVRVVVKVFFSGKFS